MNPYEVNPTYETRNLRLRLVATNDASDLLKCYSDPSAVAQMNPYNCTNNFYYTSIEQMLNCISSCWGSVKRSSQFRGSTK